MAKDYGNLTPKIIKLLEKDPGQTIKELAKQAEQLKEFALAQQLRNILATEQEHAMDLRQALGK